MHNNIMAAGSKDRPPMLGPGRYSQWRSRFLWNKTEIPPSAVYTTYNYQGSLGIKTMTMLGYGNYSPGSKRVKDYSYSKGKDDDVQQA
ncbi:hypothetical protein Tco_0373402 [Tanacetum coccineum]